MWYSDITGNKRTGSVSHFFSLVKSSMKYVTSDEIFASWFDLFGEKMSRYLKECGKSSLSDEEVEEAKRAIKEIGKELGERGLKRQAAIGYQDDALGNALITSFMEGFAQRVKTGDCHDLMVLYGPKIGEGCVRYLFIYLSTKA